MANDRTSPEEILGLVQKLMKERTDREGAATARSNVAGDSTVVLGGDPAPGSGSAMANSVAYVPAIPSANVGPNQVLRIIGARMVRGWVYGAQSANPPPPMGQGSAYDGYTGNFGALLR